MARPRKKAKELVLARATVNLAGWRAGQLAWVRPDAPKVAELLEAGLIVEERPLPGESPPDNASDSNA